MIDYIIIGVIAIALVLIVYRGISKAKKGETGCGCGCNSCPSSGECHPEEQDK